MRQSGLALRSDDAIDDSTVARHDQSRNGLCVETGRGARIVIDVDLHDFDFACIAHRKPLQHRRDHRARPAPGRPKVDEYEVVGVQGCIKSASPASTSHGRGWWQDAHWGRPEDATGTRFLVPQDGHTAIELMLPRYPLVDLAPMATIANDISQYGLKGARDVAHPRSSHGSRRLSAQAGRLGNEGSRCRWLRSSYSGPTRRHPGGDSQGIGREADAWLSDHSRTRSAQRGLWRPSAGSIYPTLQLLADEGLIEATETAGKKVFSLTEDGKVAVADLAAEPAPWDVAAAVGDVSGILDLRGVRSPIGFRSDAGGPDRRQAEDRQGGGDPERGAQAGVHPAGRGLMLT